jgi:hypothetical protein
MTSKTNLGAYGIMYVIENKKNEVISLLLKNGVAIPSNATNLQIGLIVTNLLKSSKSFYKDFSKLLLNQDTIVGMSSNMSGSYLNGNGMFDINNYEIDDSLFNPTKSKTTTTTSKTNDSDSKPSAINKGLELLQTAFQGYLQLDENKTKRELASASVIISQDNVTKDENNPPPKGLSTGAIIGLSVLGIAVVGTITYFIIKKQ